MANTKKDNEQMTLNGRVVHARPSSVSKKSPKKVISKAQLEEANKKLSGTSILDEQEQVLDAAKDKKPVKVVHKEAVINPDTTVLGNENFVNFEVDEPKPKPKAKKPVKVPRSAVEKKPVKKPVKSVKKAAKKEDSKLKVISRDALKKANIADDKSTTVIAENTAEVSTAEKKVVKKPAAKKTTAKAKTKKTKKTECKLTRLSNKETVVVSKDDFVIGKSKYSDYQVTKNNTISRSHAIIHILDDGAFMIEDNDSKNGTCVDGVYLSAHEQLELKDGQTIRLSDEVFRVKIKG